MRSSSNSGRVWVLGAGASAFAGYPLADGLLPFIRNLQATDFTTGQIAQEVLGKLNDAETHFSRKIVRNPNSTASLEELLTYLELYHSFPGTIFAVNPWDARDSGAIRRVITEKFLGYQYDVQKAAWGSGRPICPIAIDIDQFRRLADSWPKRIAPGDAIVTFNWDILHEVVLWRAGLWSYKDGYGFQSGSQGNREADSRVLMLKLHGSVNWVQRDEDDVISEIANVPDFFSKSQDWDAREHVDQAQRDSGRKLILPTYLKDISSNKVLLNAWTQAQDAIARAKELTVIGYSLNRVDHPARLLFGTALNRNTNLSEITVISPEATEWDSFLGQVGKRLIHVRARFEEWIVQ